MSTSDIMNAAYSRGLVVNSIHEDGVATISGEREEIYQLIGLIQRMSDMPSTIFAREMFAGLQPNVNLSKYDKSALYIIELISTPATREAVIGDLLEGRDKIMEQHGERKAQFYFWWQVLRTIGHFAYAWVRRLRWIAVALGFMGWMARKFSS